ncbi:dienelactone hydrolase family protein [Nocardioides pocheonensis]|uniref:Dienelactone hydrolase family protein n=1 Tax=Nocardioides pocheonensis TaxID=661485 RepID=A0A3N0GQG7_9ACTN|nr:dienelactone hydrolase family protein [Nocardioides pocheonensis]
MVTVAVPDGTAEAWVSRPADDAPHPGVLLFMDAFGIRPQIEQMADRIAGWGYVVLAPNVFHRDGTIEELAPTVDLRAPEAREQAIAEAMGRVRGLTARLAERDIPAYVDALRALPDVADGPIGVTGYCMGARLAVRAACLRPDDVAACAGFHGGGLANQDADSPHHGLPRARAEFYFGHADGDRSMTPEAIERLDAALADAGLTHTSEVYEGAPHGYTMADTSSYQEAGAERHYVTLRDLLDRTLRPAG